MKVAICGYPPLALQLQAALQNSGIEFKYFITDFVSDNFITNLPPINFFEFRWLINSGELDGVIIVETANKDFVKNAVRLFKFYDIPKVIVADLVHINPFNLLYLLNKSKMYIPYLETNIIDGCNLNCKGCTHFSPLFRRDEIYPLETFRSDVCKLSQILDVQRFRLLGGEPLLLKNLDEYIYIARKYFPQTNLRIVTNGLLIPTLPQKILDAIRNNNCCVDITAYAPTLKIANKIKTVLETNKIVFKLSNSAKNEFKVFMRLNSGSIPEKSRAVCINNSCRFLRNGKIYKCPIDALSYRFAEMFGIENYPHSTGIDIYAENFSLLIKMLDDNVELCHWCSEKVRQISWTPTSNPKLEDWLADPNELKNFL